MMVSCIHPSLSAAIALVALALPSATEASNRAEHALTQGGSFLATSADIDIEGARAHVDAARIAGDEAALEPALLLLANLSLQKGEFRTAEAAYAEALRLAEEHGGRDSERALVPLRGLGLTLARAGHHREAVPHLQRALAIERVQYGLFDIRQQDTLAQLAASLTALNRMTEAQDHMLYRVRVAEKTYGEASPKVIPSLCELGDWFAENLMSLQARMSFQMALNIVGATPALRDPIIVEPLRGLARTRMRARSYPPSPHRPHESPVPRYDSMGVPLPGPREFNREGEEALRKALRILDEDPSASTPATLIETLLQMGDWYQIEKSPQRALPYYQRAWQLIQVQADLPESVRTAMDVPLRVYYPTPPIVTHIPVVAPEDTRFHHVRVEFHVTADGAVRDARIVDHDTREKYARDVLEAVRDSRFRPKFVDGKPVATRGVTYREVFWTGKPRD